MRVGAQSTISLTNAAAAGWRTLLKRASYKRLCAIMAHIIYLYGTLYAYNGGRSDNDLIYF